MSCSAWLEAISARADGEDPGVDLRLLDAHLAGCGSCRSFAAAIDGSRRRTLLAPAAAMPDLSHRVSRLNAIADRASRWGLVRALLAVVAIEVIAFAIPALVLGDGGPEGDGAHDARHLGAFSIAYGLSLLLVVVRPARARAVLPVAGFLAGALSITAVVDLLNGVVPWNGELTHVPEILSVLLVWWLSVPGRRPGGSRRGDGSDRAPTARAVLRVVPNASESDGATRAG